jgi:hypothetical protein
MSTDAVTVQDENQMLNLMKHANNSPATNSSAASAQSGNIMSSLIDSVVNVFSSADSSNEQINQQTNEQSDEHTNEHTNEHINEHANEQEDEQTNLTQNDSSEPSNRLDDKIFHEIVNTLAETVKSDEFETHKEEFTALVNDVMNIKKTLTGELVGDIRSRIKTLESTILSLSKINQPVDENKTKSVAGFVPFDQFLSLGKAVQELSKQVIPLVAQVKKTTEQCTTNTRTILELSSTVETLRLSIEQRTLINSKNINDNEQKIKQLINYHNDNAEILQLMYNQTQNNVDSKNISNAHDIIKDLVFENLGDTASRSLPSTRGDIASGSLPSTRDANSQGILPTHMTDAQINQTLKTSQRTSQRVSQPQVNTDNKSSQLIDQEEGSNVLNLLSQLTSHENKIGESFSSRLGSSREQPSNLLNDDVRQIYKPVKINRPNSSLKTPFRRI